jgi:mono/diheme cytochrome c family protein
VSFATVSPAGRENVVKVRTVVAIATAVLALDGWISSGRAEEPAKVFKENCAKCHGETGLADTPVSATLKVPKLAGDSKVAPMAVADIVAMMKSNEKHKTMLKKATEEQLVAGATHAKALAEGK